MSISAFYAVPVANTKREDVLKEKEKRTGADEGFHIYLFIHIYFSMSAP